MEVERKKILREQEQDLELTPSNSGRQSQRVNIASELWGMVIAITTGIEMSANATENVTDFESILERDYKIKNIFELSNQYPIHLIF